MSTFANDLFSKFNERWNEVYLLLRMIEHSSDDSEIDAICRATTVLIIANFEGFLVDTIKVFIDDVNRFGSFKHTPYEMKRTHCSQFINVEDGGNGYRLNKLIESLSGLNAKYDSEQFLHEKGKNPKPTVIEEYFRKISGNNFFSYIADCDLEKVFENDNEFYNTQFSKLYTCLINGTKTFPYSVDISELSFNQENKKVRECIWMTFLGETLKKRHSVAHGETFDNVSSLPELRSIVDKIKLLELCFAIMCCHSLAVSATSE